MQCINAIETYRGIVYFIQYTLYEYYYFAIYCNIMYISNIYLYTYYFSSTIIYRNKKSMDFTPRISNVNMIKKLE